MRLPRKAVVGPSGLQAFVQGALLCGEVTDALFEGGVLGGELLDGIVVVLMLGKVVSG
jgi:hypothetical protein